MLNYKVDLNLILENNEFIWVGGVDVYYDTNPTPITRLVFERKPFDYIDQISMTALKNMSDEEKESYKERLKNQMLSDQQTIKFLNDFEEAISKGLYKI